MHPTAKSFADATRVFIVPMQSEEAEAMFPAVSGLPQGQQVFVVLSEAGWPLLITDTRAEAIRQIGRNDRVELTEVH